MTEPHPVHAAGSTLRTGVVGCGLIGRRRAEEAARHPRTRVVVVADVDPNASGKLAAALGARATWDWREVVASPDVDAVCVATPNGFLAEIACAALAAGKHVLIEKPMGRDAAEARAIAEAAARAKRHVKVGFNHRYHPAIARARAALREDAIGAPINARVRYGHGGRPGYENEWRGDARLAGGGELTDQGVHVVDLLHWFLGVPREVYAVTQTAVWPLGALEDNGFGLLRYDGGLVASFHTSWTQWQNLFSFEIFGERGALIVEGLGRSYGVETLTIVRRTMQGGVPETDVLAFDEPDESWRDEWDDFVRGILDGTRYLGDANDGIVAMETLGALYRSARTNAPVRYGDDV
ncbi:MAG TPA: Gfo/Idh/MocA family oxidoreductase [Candidatus Baltobacteraceae bacterium]|nr:Gfo/Idh/MocA family oxidoreductase [Candidatus Baltobacteraceae bacterium]